jgi:hypothetical protein
MYLVVIAWVYVALMMAVAEATSTQGSVLGGAMTFLLYGAGPLALVVYLMGAPGRRKARLQHEAAERAAAVAAGASTHAAVSSEPTAPTAAASSAAQAAPAAPAASDALAAPAAPAASPTPDAGRHPPADPVAPVRKKP